MLALVQKLRLRILPKKSTPILAVLGQGVVLMSGANFEMRVNPDRARISVADNAVLGCQITLERQSGNVLIGENTFIGKGTKIICAQGVSIGAQTLISWGCTIIDHDSHSISWSDRAADVQTWREGLQLGINQAAARKDWSKVQTKEIFIGNKVWIGFNSIILKGVYLGDGAVVGAGSVVTHDVPPWTIVAGNPARVIRTLSSDER